MLPQTDDDIGSLEKKRKRLYEPDAVLHTRHPLTAPQESELPHAWGDHSLENVPYRQKRYVHLAGVFFVVAFLFFVISLGTAGYLFYFGGNAISVDKIIIDVQGPTTIAGGDIVPLSLTITNKNSAAIDNATIEINFPSGTRSVGSTSSAYPRYTENLGQIASGATVTRTVKAVVFGGAGQALLFPISFSYGTAGSNSTFVKESSYTLSVSSTPLSVSIDTLSETISGKPLTFTLTVRSNANVPLENVLLTVASPFGFSVTGSSPLMSGSNFLLGSLLPGEKKTVTLTGILVGQENEQRVFHFSVGTAKSASDQTLAVSYMTQDATVTITAPFIITTLALNNNTRPDVVVTSGSRHSVTVSYVNTLNTAVTNATVAVTLSGSAVDYNSIQTTSGFYRSTDHTIIFSRDTDPSLATLAPGASGIGSFTFSTLPAHAIGATPTATFTISVSGTRVGQTNVLEHVSASFVKTVKIATTITLSASSLHISGSIPPRVGQTTTYTIVWNARNGLSSIADGIVSAVLPSYVSYNDLANGAGSFSYDSGSRMVSWNIGDIAQGANAQGTFQVSFTPSSSQVGSAPPLTSALSFSGHDRFAGVQITASADPSTTDTKGDPGYIGANAFVQ